MSEQAAKPAGPVQTKRSDLLIRILSSAILGPLVIGAAWSDRFGWWYLLITIASMLALREAFSIVRSAGRMPVAWLGLATVPFLTQALAPTPWESVIGSDSSGARLAFLALALAVVAGYSAQMLREPGRRSFEDWAIGIALSAHVGVLGSFAVGLRSLDDGRFWAILFLALIWTNDSAAYLGGRRFGRTPMAPVLSPKKTYEGLVIATMTTMLVGAATPAMLSAFAITAPAGPVQLALVGLAISLVGPLGDLSISLLKRQAGVKDSGHIIPGHGGVLDRTDSLFFAAPIMYLAALALGG